MTALGWTISQVRSSFFGASVLIVAALLVTSQLKILPTVGGSLEVVGVDQMRRTSIALHRCV